MTKKGNRRFVFERVDEPISLKENASSTDQLYVLVRENLDFVRRTSNEHETQRQRRNLIKIPSNSGENVCRKTFLAELEAFRSAHRPSNEIDSSTLREENLLYWKSIKRRWSDFYRQKMKTDESRLAELVRMTQLSVSSLSND